MRCGVELASDPAEVGRARRWVRTQLARCGLPEMVEAAELVVSELVANAVEHTGGPVRLRLEKGDGGLVLAVADTSPTPPAQRQAGVGETSGRGLELVAASSIRWGWTPEGRGKTVWCHLPASEPEPDAADPAAGDTAATPGAREVVA